MDLFVFVEIFSTIFLFLILAEQRSILQGFQEGTWHICAEYTYMYNAWSSSVMEAITVFLPILNTPSLTHTLAPDGRDTVHTHRALIGKVSGQNSCRYILLMIDRKVVDVVSCIFIHYEQASGSSMAYEVDALAIFKASLERTDSPPSNRMNVSEWRKAFALQQNGYSFSLARIYISCLSFSWASLRMSWTSLSSSPLECCWYPPAWASIEP